MVCPESVIRVVALRMRMYWVTLRTMSNKGQLKKSDMAHLKMARNYHRTVAGVPCGSGDMGLGVGGRPALSADELGCLARRQ